jgi:SAM-dependent methyltransferase
VAESPERGVWHERFLASVERRGLFGALVAAPRRAAEVLVQLTAGRWFDMRKGVDTSTIVRLRALQIESENRDRGVNYEATASGSFYRMMRSLRIPTDGGFVDFGSGKGRVLLMACDLGFPKVTGVEFSAELCGIAERNVAAESQRRAARVEIHNVDATEYQIAHDDHVFYFFNPFDGTVLSQVVSNIEVSLAAFPRRVWVIYHHPLHRSVIDERPAFREVSSVRYGRLPFVLFTNRQMTGGD